MPDLYVTVQHSLVLTKAKDWKRILCFQNNLVLRKVKVLFQEKKKALGETLMLSSFLSRQTR